MLKIILKKSDESKDATDRGAYKVFKRVRSAQEVLVIFLRMDISMLKKLKRTFLGRRQDERTLGSKCKGNPSPLKKVRGRLKDVLHFIDHGSLNPVVPNHFGTTDWFWGQWRWQEAGGRRSSSGEFCLLPGS